MNEAKIGLLQKQCSDARMLFATASEQLIATPMDQTSRRLQLGLLVRALNRLYMQLSDEYRASTGRATLYTTC